MDDFLIGRQADEFEDDYYLDIDDDYLYHSLDLWSDDNWPEL